MVTIRMTRSTLCSMNLTRHRTSCGAQWEGIWRVETLLQYYDWVKTISETITNIEKIEYLIRFSEHYPAGAFATGQKQTQWGSTPTRHFKAYRVSGRYSVVLLWFFYCYFFFVKVLSKGMMSSHVSMSLMCVGIGFFLICKKIRYVYFSKGNKR